MADMNDFSGVDRNLTNRPGLDERTPTDWVREESWWRNNWERRPYVRADRNFDFYGPGYRYGVESANRYRGRSWNDVEPDLRTGWDSYQHRGESKWEEIKDAVRDAWDHMTGKEHGSH